MWQRALQSFLLLTAAAGQAAAATFVVTNTNDSGPGSLRQAILEANDAPGLDEIHFAIGTGPQTIQPTQVLPTVTDPVVIDGRTQPGYDGTPLVEINGALAPVGGHGIRVLSGDSRIFGLAINGFLALGSVGGHGIVLQLGGSNYVWGNVIGTDRDGTVAVPNQGDGVHVLNSSSNSIGCAAFLTFDNLISGNRNGVQILGTSNGNIVSGNYIGLDSSGTAAIPNAENGVAISFGNANGVGMPGPCVIFEGHTYRNVISGNGGDGVLDSGSQTIIRSNAVGWNALLTGPVPNASDGIELRSAQSSVADVNLVGGNGANGILLSAGAVAALHVNVVGSRGIPGAGNTADGILISGSGGSVFGNVIGGNEGNGIALTTGARRNFIYDNRIGLDANDQPVPNLGNGIEVRDGAIENSIGATPGTGPNIVGFNGGNGILIRDPETTLNGVGGNLIGTTSALSPAPNGSDGIAILNEATGNGIGGNTIRYHPGAGIFVDAGVNRIRGNGIDLNNGLGIDLAPRGVTPNDPLDSDAGPNGLQNFPVLNSAIGANGQTIVTGTIESTPLASLEIDFYASPNCDPSGNGEGASPIGSTSVTLDAAGHAAINVSLPIASPGRAITATATEGLGTSEFSPCVFTPLPLVTSIAPDSGAAAGGYQRFIGGMTFQIGASVTIGGSAAPSAIVLGPSEILAGIPALSPGTLNDVTVFNPDGQSGTLEDAFFADFTDVPAFHPFHDFVETIFRAGVTAGCGGGSYCVDDIVTRAQIAVLLLRSQEGSSYVPPPETGLFFDDVPLGSFAAAWIEEIVRRSVSAGCGFENYCPNDPVTRAQMSVMLLRTLEGDTYNPPPATGTVFTDVPIDAFAAAWIEEIARRGITAGCGGGNFCSGASASRGEMAVFLVETFGL